MLTPVRATVFGFVTVIVSTRVLPTPMGEALNAAVTVGATTCACAAAGAARAARDASITGSRRAQTPMRPKAAFRIPDIL